MKTTAIIAEYNPFHNGHLYQLNEARARSGADYIVIIMSGNFVQRGEPALIDKYARTRMALESGADLVLELPAAYACSSAESFAGAAVAILDGLGAVNTLCYGSEFGDSALTHTLSSLLLEEPASFSRHLRQLLTEGFTYPQAWAAAAKEYLTQCEGCVPACFDTILASPNWILGLEYQKALKRLHSSIEPLPILRRGDYHSEAIPDEESQSYASASAIRRILLNKKHPQEKSSPDVSRLSSDEQSPCAGSLLATQLPPCTLRQLTGARLLEADDFSAALGYALLRCRDTELTSYLDISPDLAARIRRLLPRYQSFASFTDELKTRQLTRSRVSRALLHLLLDIRTDAFGRYRQDGYAYYARVLGFRRQSLPVFALIKQNGRIPLLTKMADARKVLTDFYGTDRPQRLESALSLLDTDLFAASLYELTAASGSGHPPKNEFSNGLIILDS